VRWDAMHGSVLAPCCGARRRGAGIRTTVGRHEIEPWQTAVDACATRNRQRTTDNTQRTTDNTQRTTDNGQARGRQRALLIARTRLRVLVPSPSAQAHAHALIACWRVATRVPISAIGVCSGFHAALRRVGRTFGRTTRSASRPRTPTQPTQAPPHPRPVCARLTSWRVHARVCVCVCACVRAREARSLQPAVCPDRGGRSAAVVRSQGTTSTTLRPSCSGSSDTRSASSRHPLALLRLSRSPRRPRPHPLSSRTPLPSDAHPQPSPPYPKPYTLNPKPYTLSAEPEAAIPKQP
jgi:hypothetical protein